MTVVISGIGIVAPCDLTPLAQGPVAPRSDWPEITLIDVPAGAPEIANECASFKLADEVPTKYPFIDRCSALALGAAARALKDAGLGIERTRTETIGLCFATSWGCLDAMRTFYEKIKEGKPQFSSPLPFSHSFANTPSSLLAIEFGLHGFATTWSGGQGCAEAALESAVGALASGVADRIVLVASDAISHGTFHHYWATGQLAADGAAAARGEGFVLAEGAVALVLETAAAFATRNRPPAPELFGPSRVPLAGKMSDWFSRNPVARLWLDLPARMKEAQALKTILAAAQAAGVDTATEVRWPQHLTGCMMSASPLLALALAAQSGASVPAVVMVDDLANYRLFGARPAAAPKPAKTSKTKQPSQGKEGP